jgi:multiple sugar transport system permease protein
VSAGIGAPRPLILLRDAAAILTVLVFMFPLLWWGLDSIRPNAALYDASGSSFLHFTPSLDHYRLVLGPDAPAAFDGKSAFVDSILIASGSAVLAISLGLPMAFGLSRLRSASGQVVLSSLILFRFLPPIALVVPVFVLFNDIGLADSRLGLLLMHAVMALPLVVLMLKSFFDEIPREVDEAARIDGASGWRVFRSILVPQIKGGISAAALLAFLASWTEFLFALFLSRSFRTLPVKLSIVSGLDWGPLAALGTASLFPAFIFILLAQRSLVRGLSLGTQK